MSHNRTESGEINQNEKQLEEAYKKSQAALLQASTDEEKFLILIEKNRRQYIELLAQNLIHTQNKTFLSMISESCDALYWLVHIMAKEPAKISSVSWGEAYEHLYNTLNFVYLYYKQKEESAEKQSAFKMVYNALTEIKKIPCEREKAEELFKKVIVTLNDIHFEMNKSIFEFLNQIKTKYEAMNFSTQANKIEPEQTGNKKERRKARRQLLQQKKQTSINITAQTAELKNSTASDEEVNHSQSAFLEKSPLSTAAQTPILQNSTTFNAEPKYSQPELIEPPISVVQPVVTLPLPVETTTLQLNQSQIPNLSAVKQHTSESDKVFADIQLDMAMIAVENAVLKASSHPLKAKALLHSVNRKVQNLLTNEHYRSSFIIRAYGILTATDIKSISKQTLLECFRTYESEKNKYLVSVPADKIQRATKYWENLRDSLLGTYYAKECVNKQKDLEKLLRASHGNVYFNFSGADFRGFDLSDVCLVGSNLNELYFSGFKKNEKTILNLMNLKTSPIIAEYEKELYNCQDSRLKLKIVNKLLNIVPNNVYFHKQKLLVKYQISIEEKDWFAASLLCEKIIKLETNAKERNILHTRYWLLKGISFFYLNRYGEMLNCLNRIIIDKNIFQQMLKNEPYFVNEIENMMTSLAALNPIEKGKIINKIQFIENYFPENYKTFENRPNIGSRGLFAVDTMGKNPISAQLTPNQSGYFRKKH